MRHLLVNVLLTTPTLTFPIFNNPPVHHRLVLMWTLTGKFDSEPITNLAVAAQSKQGFGTAFFLPGTQDILGVCSAMELDHNECVNQVFLEDDTQKHNKTIPQLLSVKNIYHCSVIEGGCANLMSVLLMLIEFDTTAVVGNEVPFLHKTDIRIALMTSSTLFCRYQERYPGTAKA